MESQHEVHCTLQGNLHTPEAIDCFIARHTLALPCARQPSYSHFFTALHRSLNPEQLLATPDRLTDRLTLPASQPLAATLPPPAPHPALPPAMPARLFRSVFQAYSRQLSSNPWRTQIVSTGMLW